MSVLILGGGPNSLGEQVAWIYQKNMVVAEVMDLQFGDDFTKENSWKSILSVLNFRRPEALINFVGSISVEKCEDLTLTEFSKTLETNLLPLANCAKALANYKWPISFIQIGSNTASYPFSSMFSYATAKAAQKQAVKILAKEIAPRSRANMINPGPFHPESSSMSANQIKLAFGEGTTPEEGVAKYTSRIPMGRMTSVDDLWSTICYLNANSFMTGQVIEVSGGMILNG